MSELTATLTDPALATFARRFLNRALEHGFSSMSKKELELLLFFEMELAGVVSGTADNHAVARDLRLTPQRVRSLRRDAWARWATQRECRAHLRATLEDWFSRESLETVLREHEKLVQGEKLIPVLLEHPGDRAELEQLLKRRRSVPQHDRNSEVLLVPVRQLITLATDLLESEAADPVIANLKRAVEKDSTIKSLLVDGLEDFNLAKLRSALGNSLASMLESATLDVGTKALAAVFGSFLRV
jgi:hypothetical protein